MAESFEYAIKKDVRNNPIIREVDARQRTEFLQTGGAWALIVLQFALAAMNLRADSAELKGILARVRAHAVAHKGPVGNDTLAMIWREVCHPGLPN